MTAAVGEESACGNDLKLNMSGVEDKEEFDQAASLVKFYCKQITEDEFEEQGASETEKALEVHFKKYLSHVLRKPVFVGL